MIHQQGGKQGEQIGDRIAKGFHWQFRVFGKAQPHRVVKKHQAENQGAELVDQVAHAGEIRQQGADKQQDGVVQHRLAGERDAVGHR